MHFIDQYKELYPDPVPVEPVVETQPTEAEALRAVKPLPKPAALPHATPKHK